MGISTPRSSWCKEPRGSLEPAHSHTPRGAPHVRGAGLHAHSQSSQEESENSGCPGGPREGTLPHHIHPSRTLTD